MKHYVIVALLYPLSLCAALSATSQPPQKSPAPQNKIAQTAGDDVFKANCSRCHMPPMSISPRATGTIIMHMRTRARLSREDELKLLKFMAP
jgi:hypothetical protein